MKSKSAFGTRLREARQAVGYTQQRLAWRSGYGLDTIKAWESGRRTPRLGLRLKKLFEALQLSAREADELVLSSILGRLNPDATAVKKFNALGGRLK